MPLPMIRLSWTGKVQHLEVVMKSPLRNVAVLAMLALTAIVGPVSAQTRDDVSIAIERTDDLIARAQDVVGSSDNAQAQFELAAAVRIQADAKTEFAAAHFVLALDLTRRARLHADKAIALVSGLPDPDRVLVQLERTRELLDRARERIEECNLDRARAMLRAALEMQVRAEASARDGRYLAALQLTMSARERALRALRMCNLEDNLHDAAERALARTDELISRARDLVAEHDSERARQALNRAVELEAEAWAQFRADHLEASLRLTQSARSFVHRAIRLAGVR
jgi:tetratricopeptide (TPR) repeat protein